MPEQVSSGTNTERLIAPVPRLALRPKEAAAALGIGQRKLWELTNCGAIPHVKAGNCTLYPVEALNQWLAEQSGHGSR